MGGRRGHKRRAEPGSDAPPAQAQQPAADKPEKPEKPQPFKKQKRDQYSNNSQTVVSLPRKKFYRQRAHANPFSDHALEYPASPEEMDWASHFPAYASKEDQACKIQVADIGCGFGGLLFALAHVMPETLMLGMEIRTSVTEFVANKIKALRHQSANPNQQTSIPEPPAEETGDAVVSTPTKGTTTSTPDYQNLSVIRANTMKFLPNFFPKAALHSIFLCFPDPHFKARKHKARIVSTTLCSEYAYVLRPGGLVYTITDVEDLAQWMARHLDAHALFDKVDHETLQGREGESVRIMMSETEEGKKVTRNKGRKFVGVWRRREDPAWPGPVVPGAWEAGEEVWD